MKVILHNRGASGKHVSERLLGHNIETLDTTVAGFMANRLSNPKFLGPADPNTGLAPGWHPSPSNNIHGVRFHLTQGLSLSGNESQLIHVYDPVCITGIVQTKRHVYRGERLQVTLWARAQHFPVDLIVGIGSPKPPEPLWAVHELKVDVTYWKEYTFTLDIPQTAPAVSDDAVFFIHVRGQGMVWLDQVSLHPVGQVLNEPLLQAIEGLDIPVLRFPGGCLSANYHWRFGTGPRHLRPVLADPVFKWHNAYDFGTDEYLQLCLDYGILPHISVNIGSGTPDEAGEWAAYCHAWYTERGLEPPAMYWQVGNEQWGDWEVGSMTPQMYADALHAFVPHIRANYPNARIIALGPEKAKPPYTNELVPWLDPVIEGAADMFDVLAIHCYERGYETFDEYVRELQGVAGVEGEIARIARKLADSGLEKGIAVTEWNLWHRAAHHDGAGFFEPYTTQHIMFAASMLNVFVRSAPTLELANFYHLVNAMGVFRTKGPEIIHTAMADLFKLYRPGLPGERLDVEITERSALGATDLPAVDAVAVQQVDGAVTVFAVNRDWQREAILTLDGFPHVRDAAALVGTALGDEPQPAVATADPAITLPPLSVTRIRLA